MSPTALSPADILGALLTTPFVSVVLGVVAAGLIMASPRWRAHLDRPFRTTADGARSVAHRYTPEHRTLGIGALLVLGVALASELLAGYVLDLNGQVSWWRYANPVLTAFLTLTALAIVIAVRGRRPPEQPVMSVTRRSWVSFGPPTALVGAAIALLIVVLTIVAAGSASSAVDGGPFVFLELPAPNTDVDPVRVWFFGWAYGLPLLGCCAALFAAGSSALSLNASRPFLRPETVAAEHRQRRDVAAGIARIAAGGVLLAVAGAWRFIGDAGGTGPLTVMGEGSYEIVWRYADLAIAAGRLAPVLEVIATVLLLLTASGLRTRGATGAKETAESRQPENAP